MFELSRVIHTIDLPSGQWREDGAARAAAKAMKVEDRVVFHYVDGGSSNPHLRDEIAKLCAQKACMVVSDSNHAYEHGIRTLIGMNFMKQKCALLRRAIKDDSA